MGGRLLRHDGAAETSPETTTRTAQDAGRPLRLAHEDCAGFEPISTRRVADNPKARQVGPAVFTPLALSRTIGVQPYDIAGAPGAGAGKIGITVVAGGPTATVGIRAPGGARLIYGSELLGKLADGEVRWAELPETIVFERCRGDRGEPIPTAFPGGFVPRRPATCVTLTVTGAGRRSATRIVPFGRRIRCGA